jgi:thioredoxin-related protein
MQTLPNPSVARDQLVGRIAVGAAAAAILLVLLTTVALAVPGVRTALGFERARGTGYAVGQRVDLVPPGSESRRHTLLIFARHDCGACQQSKSAFADLVRDLREQGVDTVIVTNQHQRPSQVAYGQELGVREERVLSLDLSTLKVQLVPSIVLVDRAGTVVYARAGALAHDDRAAVARTLGTLIR